MILSLAKCTTGHILLGSKTSEQADGDDWKSLAPHRDEEQIMRDVDRSFVYYPKGKIWCVSLSWLM
jgi:hypothetical protein